ncbi:MAG: hypothetical protein PVJ08_07420 [Dehalococcoidia bacterium]|jgi:predicted transcriptional regulator
MQWELIVILVIAIPVILFPAAYVWYINIGGLIELLKEERVKRAIMAWKLNPLKKAKRKLEYEKALTKKLQKYPW